MVLCCCYIIIRFIWLLVCFLFCFCCFFVVVLLAFCWLFKLSFFVMVCVDFEIKNVMGSDVCNCFSLVYQQLIVTIAFSFQIIVAN